VSLAAVGAESNQTTGNRPRSLMTTAGRFLLFFGQERGSPQEKEGAMAFISPSNSSVKVMTGHTIARAGIEPTWAALSERLSENLGVASKGRRPFIPE
jgi:hypothetical protein